MRMCRRCKTEPTPTSRDWYCPECKDIAMKEAKRNAQQRWMNNKKTYEYQKNDGVEAFKPKPQPMLSSPASQRWAKMSLTELDRELLYYKMDYGQSQIMAKNNTLPEGFGLEKEG